MQYRPSRKRSTTTQQLDSETRASRRGRRARQAARERRIAVVALVAVAVVGILGAVLHQSASTAHAATTAATVASNSASHKSLTCPYNGCTASKCHAKTASKSRRKASKRSSSHTIASMRIKTAPTLTAQSQSSSAAQVAAKARVTSSAASARRSVAMAASPKPSTHAKKTPARSTATAKSKARGTITIVTFGYSFAGPPSGSKYVADVRNIDAGSFSQDENGLMASVRARVMATAAAKAWHTKMRAEWLPNLSGGDKIAIGCARGHHRSVSLAVVFAADLEAHGFTVNLVNRDIHKTW